MPSPPQRFYSYSRYLKEKYGQTAYRVSVDGGFSCPNRGPDRSAPGCAYCDEPGSRAPYLGAAGGVLTAQAPGSWKQRCEQLRAQIGRARRFLEARYRARVYLLYFQAFSGTHAPVRRLKQLYDFALGCAPFSELIVSTRPDCIDREKARLLASYRDRGLDVWVELGLQSALDPTLQRVGRGHTIEDFHRAFRLCRAAGVKLAVHLIFGLPGEGLAEILHTITQLAAVYPEAVKIHNLHIPTGCPLYREYLGGELSVPCAGRHLEYVIRALELLSPDTVIMRLTCDTPSERLAAPLGFWPKARFLERLREELERRDTWQGRLFSAEPKRRPPS